MSCQAPLFFTQPPQYRCRCGEGPRNEHHSTRCSYRLHGHAEGSYRVLDYEGSPLTAAEEAVLEVRGVRGPLALRARQHDNVCFTFQPGKHTCGVFLSQDTEYHAQRTLAIQGAHPGERRREPGHIVPTVDHHGDALDLVYLEPPGKRFSYGQGDLLLELGGETLLQQ